MCSPFAVLDVAPDADDGEIEAAYRRRVKDAHPDQGGTIDEFQRVRDAYRTIQSDDIHDVADDAFADAEDDVRGQSRVEYLNYAVLDDFGWTVDDPALFERAASAPLATEDYGRFVVQPDETLLEAAENRSYAWPFACRGGACANCAVAVVEGDLEQPVDHILPEELLERDIRLSCNGRPATDELKILYNVKRMPDLEELRLPPGPFARAKADD